MNALTLPETTSGEYSFRYIDIGSVSEDGKVTLDEPIRFDEAPSRARRVVKRNDVLISTVRTYLKAIAPVDFDATDLVASTGFAVCTPTKGTHPRYLAYAVRSDGVIDEICKESCGISYPAINSTKLAGIEITYCDAELQRQIVAYLDEKFTVIDRKVALLEQKRTAYAKLKRALINETVTRGLDKNAELDNSGNDRLEVVSNNGRVRRLKDCVLLRNVKTDDQREPYIALENIKSWDASFIQTEVETEGTNNRCKAGDILFGKLRPYLAKGYIPDNDAICSTEFLVMTAKPQFHNRFILYFLLSNSVIDYLAHQVAGVKMPRTNWVTVAAWEMPRIAGRTTFLNFSEQRRIADYLDRKCAAIDAAVENVTRQIELYRKLKRSLIDEVVTGRRKVA